MIFRCPITYKEIQSFEKYSTEGLRLLSRNLNNLSPLPFNATQLRQEAEIRAGKMSIQGVQPKLSAILNTSKSCFEIVDAQGQFILKPSLAEYKEVPANEAISMTMAAEVGIEVPLHGLLYDQDETYTYFIKRFDRMPRKNKCPVEDFAQLSGNTRDTKYNFSMEKLVPVIEKYCTFPLLAKHQLFQRVIFNYLIGNEDMHLKNFSLITRQGKTELAPAYDFLNTTIILPKAKEELALSLNGKKSNLHAKDFIEYYAYERLSLNANIVLETLQYFKNKIPKFLKWIDISFLSPSMKNAYREILTQRSIKLSLL